MKCDVKQINQCTKLVSIEVSGDKILQAFDTAYKKIANEAKVPGFRQGKAPRKMLEQKYADVAREEVIKKVVTDSFYEAANEHKFNMFNYPEFEDVNFDGTTVKFKAKVEERPEITVKKYKGISAKEEKIKIEEKEIDDVIDRIRDGQAKFVPVEDRGIEIGDFAVCDIESKIEGLEAEKKENEWCEIRENDMMADFAQQTVGMRPGDEKEINVTLAKDFPNKEIAGKKANFVVNVKEIKKKELPELDEAFLKNLGEYKTVTELRESIKKDIEARKKQDVRAKLERDIIDKIEKDVKFDLPESLVKRRLEGMVQEATQNMLRQGYPQDALDSKKEEMQKEFETEARRQVKVAFILDKIAEEEKIDVTDEDISAHFQNLGAQFRMSADHVREYYEKNNMISSVHAELRNQNVIDFCVDNAEIK